MHKILQTSLVTLLQEFYSHLWLFLAKLKSVLFCRSHIGMAFTSELNKSQTWFESQILYLLALGTRANFSLHCASVTAGCKEIMLPVWQDVGMIKRS